MDMSKPSNNSDVQGWKPYLHTSLFSPFSNQPESGEAFLFPTFRIYSRTTFLAACLFTFALALVERWFSFLLETSLKLHHQTARMSAGPARAAVKRKQSDATELERTVYVHLPDSILANSKAQSIRKGGEIKMLLRTTVFFSATLLRYVLMIISMGMDWMMLLSVVSGLTSGQLCTDLWRSSARRGRARSGARTEEMELLEHEEQPEPEQEKLVDDKEGPSDGFLIGGARDSRRRSTSRQSSADLTAY